MERFRDGLCVDASISHHTWIGWIANKADLMMNLIAWKTLDSNRDLLYKKIEAYGCYYQELHNRSQFPFKHSLVNSPFQNLTTNQRPNISPPRLERPIHTPEQKRSTENSRSIIHVRGSDRSKWRKQKENGSKSQVDNRQNVDVQTSLAQTPRSPGQCLGSTKTTPYEKNDGHEVRDLQTDNGEGKDGVEGCGRANVD